MRDSYKLVEGEKYFINFDKENLQYDPRQKSGGKLVQLSKTIDPEPDNKPALIE